MTQYDNGTNVKGKLKFFLPYIAVLLFTLFLAYISGMNDQRTSAYYFLRLWFGWLLAVSLYGCWVKEKFKWNGYILFFCLIPLIGTQPLFENDHYRYLWEGKVFLEGLNPWKIPPDSSQLDFISFPERKHIGFSHLTSPYSPLAVIYHSLFATLNISKALMALQLVNAALCSYALSRLPPMLPFFAIGLAGLLAKEFTQSVHLDLICWVLMMLSLNDMNRKHVTRSGILFLMSSLFKINVLIVFPWFISEAYRINKFKGAVPWLVLLSISLCLNYLGPLSLSEISGLASFLKSWVWHPGALSVWLWSGADMNSGIEICNIIWIIVLFILGVWCFFKRFDGWNWITFVYAATAFLRPAFNPWYTPWFALSSTWAFSQSLIFYALFSPLSYTRYATSNPVFLNLSIILTHVWIFIFFLEKRKTV